MGLGFVTGRESLLAGVIKIAGARVEPGSADSVWRIRRDIGESGQILAGELLRHLANYRAHEYRDLVHFNAASKNQSKLVPGIEYRAFNRAPLRISSPDAIQERHLALPEIGVILQLEDRVPPRGAGETSRSQRRGVTAGQSKPQSAAKKQSTREAQAQRTQRFGQKALRIVSVIGNRDLLFCA